MRARWEKEDQGRGTWAVVVTEIPYQVQKARLIEKIAELLIARKLPLLDDVRDESAEDIRIVLSRRAAPSIPALMMESLFKLTELESRILAQHERAVARARCPTSCRCTSVLQEWLDHRKDVLVRRSQLPARPRSSGGWKSSAAISSPISTSTR